MRKSLAPSQRKSFVSPLINKDVTLKEDPKFSLCHSDLPTQELDENNAELPKGSNITKIFNIVYGKQSKKKHKTWEGDGFLLVGEKGVTLQDTEGKVLGRASHKKPNELVEGSRLFVGSKEVELLDECTEVKVSKKRLASPTGEDDCKLKKKIKNVLKPTVNQIAVMSSSFPISHSVSIKVNREGYILPRPSEDHQWHCNVDHLPVVNVCVENALSRHLRPHQKEGVTFLYECITGIRSLEHRGAILADEMGLGKTLQCIALIWTLLKQGPYGGKPVFKRVLVVTPSSLTTNWTNEFNKWIGSWRIQIFTVNKNNKLEDYKKNLKMPVIIVSYDQLVRNIDCVQDLNLDLIVCDEGHRLKNNNIKTTTMLNELPCKRRILMTGTPLQNDLQEFFTLVNFVNPGILGSYSEFKVNFEKPIEAGREVNASAEAIDKGEKAALKLSQITGGFILRRTQGVISSFLPSKNDYVIFCSLSPLQKKMYSTVVDYWASKEVQEEIGLPSVYSDHLSIITLMKKICNHPELVSISKKDDSLSIEHSLVQIFNSFCKSSPKDVDDYFLCASTKFAVLDSILKHTFTEKRKVIVVSMFTQTLDVVEKFCKIMGYKHARFDGSVPINLRQNIVDNFNSQTSLTNVLLLSSKAGGVGLNLVGASKLILFDSDWNPATDLQAMARIWRQGQKHPVHIYRLLMSGTIEEKIFQRQLKKAGLSESIIDPTAISGVKLSKEELKDLFSFGYECTTHAMLKCTCTGEGNIPGIPEGISSKTSEEDLPRDCLISLSDSNTENTESSLRMNQLFMWEHHCKPITSYVLEETGLSYVGEKIDYLFRNKSI